MTSELGALDVPEAASVDRRAFVRAHMTAAGALGEQLAQLVMEPDAFAARLRAGLRDLRDPRSAPMLALVSPRVTTEYAVRGPLLELVRRPIRDVLRQGSSSTALWLAQRLIEAEHRDLRLFALLPLRRALPADPELTWQLLRRMASRAEDWIEIDAMADLWARGVLMEPFRWAELEQLVYSTRAGERRLVGATLATLPLRVERGRRSDLRGEASGRAFGLVRQLMGDADPLVQKALSWAIRAWTAIDPDGAARLLHEEAALARVDGDGARAWVVRDALSPQPAALAAALRATLRGIRRRPSSPSTSVAAATSARFAAMLVATDDRVAHQGERLARSRA